MRRNLVILLAMFLVAALMPQTVSASPTVQWPFRIGVFAGEPDNNSPIANAKVTVEGVPGTFSTDAAGKTRSITDTKGVYRVHIEADGWKTADIEGLTYSGQPDYMASIYLPKGPGLIHLSFNAPMRSGPQTPFFKPTSSSTGTVTPLVDFIPFVV